MKKINLLLLLVAISGSCLAKVKLPAILSENMVLQQKSKANLWGEASKLSTVKVTTSWDNKTYTTIADANGKWKLSVKTPKAGGPFKLEFDDGEKLQLNNILIGEVWVCSGQSNMQMTLEGFKNQPVLNSETIIADAQNKDLRVFTLKRILSATPRQDCEGDWKLSNSQNAPDFSAVAFQYGQILQKELAVPVGIIVTSWGGTPIQAWMNKSLEGFETDEKLKDGNLTPSSPKVLFNGIINPLTSYTIKGFLWYQGESDRFEPETYDDKMVAMIKEWRKDWKQGDLPFYFVQIAPYDYMDKANSYSPYLREAQLQASKLVTNVEMVVTADIGAAKTIHPPDKTTVAERLSKIALSKDYRKNVSFKSPTYKSMKVKGNKIILQFSYANGLMLKNEDTRNFEIAGADKIFHTADIKITAQGVEVKADQVTSPLAVRYCFTEYFEGNLYNEAGLPAIPFRTDEWEMK